MIMKKFILFVMLAFVSFGAYAQTAIETPKFLDNTYVSVGGQVTTPLDLNGVFPLNSGVAVTLGKQLTPVFGVNVEDNVWFGSHSNGTHMYGFPHFDTNVDHNVVRGNYLGLNGTINLSNLFCDYLGHPRKFELQTVTGLGWWHVFTPNAEDKSHNDLAAKTGLNMLFNFKNGHTIYVQPAVLWNLTNPGAYHNNVAFNKNGAQLALQVGYVYHFKTSNGTHHFKTYDVGAMQNEINNLKAELAKKSKRIVVEEKVVTEKVVYKNNGKYVVFFSQNSSALTDEALETLDQIPTDAKVDVIATASPEGSKEYNATLSEDRAENVARYLNGRGVEINSVKGLGVTGESSNRVAVVTVQ